jgi:hypothetical protein
LRAVVNIIFFSRKSARGLAHSMTLRAFQKSSCRAQRLGLRWPSPAFPNITATLSHPVSEGQEGESSAVSLKTCDWICRTVIRRTGNMRTLFLLPGEKVRLRAVVKPFSACRSKIISDRSVF